MADDQGGPRQAKIETKPSALASSSFAVFNPFEREQLKWATSRSVDRVSEISVMAPIKIGCVPGERRTYEERLRATIGNLAMRAEQRTPNELDRIPTIHFGRLFIIRPEQYMVYSNIKGIDYAKDSPAVPVAIDDYKTIGMPPAGGAGDFNSGEVMQGANLPQKPPNPPELRSWLFTLVEFDGDLRVYMRDIAVFLNEAFDLIFRNCEDFPGTANFETFWLWLKRYQFPTDLFYARYPNLSVTRIKQLEEFKRRFDSFVAAVRPPTGPVESMDELFDQFLRDTQQHFADFPTPGGSYLPRDRSE